MSSDLVYNIEPASPSMIRSLDRHCIDRTTDGSSAIDPERSHLNKILVGNETGVLASLNDLYESGVQRPTRQAESPYLRIVVSASPNFFRPEDPEASGTWDQGRLDAWLEATMQQLRGEHGEDLVYAQLHLDEDTPHIHAVVAPTYERKPRVPGRKKRNETDDEFEARKETAINTPGVRTVGRSSHSSLSRRDSFQKLRERMALAVDHLGIGYGEDRSVNAPPGKTTREWVKQEAERNRREAERLKRQEIDLAEREASLRSAWADIEKERSQLAKLKRKLVAAIKAAVEFARRPEASVFEQVEARKIKKRAANLLHEAEKASPTTEDDGPGF